MNEILNGMIIGALVGVVAGLFAGLLVLLIRLMLPAKKCPDCGAPLPKVRFPSSFREAMLGGWTCDECGCRVDRKGRKI